MDISRGVADLVKGQANMVVVIIAVLAVLCLVLIFTCVWQNKQMGWVIGRNGAAEAFGSGGNNVRLQSMDQPYFPRAYEDIVPPQALANAAQQAAISEGMMVPPPGPVEYNEGSYFQTVGSDESVATKIPNLQQLLSEQARQQFMRENNCNSHVVAADPWLWKLEQTRMNSEGFSGGANVTDAVLVGQMTGSTG